MDKKKMFINGEWVNGTSGKVLDCINPATAEVIAQVEQASIEDTDKAIAAAKNSFYVDRTWRDMDSQTRGDLLLHVADLLERDSEELARLDSMENGKPLREAEGDISDGVHCFRYYAGLIKAPCGGTYNVNNGFGNMHSYMIHEPVGVVAQITPWNYPFLMAVWKLAPGLAAGNSIVFKPSSEAVLSCIKMFEIFEEAGIPKGAVNLLIGPGSTVGNRMAESNDVDMITFTGSTAVGQSIMRAAAGNLKKIGLELGGKSPLVIFEDTDIEAAVEWAMIGIFFNQGEVCSATSRIIVQRSIHDKFVKRLAEKANAITIGNPLDNPDMGPLVSKHQMERVLKYIEVGKSEGATCVCGGERYTEGECAKGYFVRPTVFDNCTADMTIVREEIFGPVASVLTFDTEEEAIQLANDTEYGLAGAVITNDGARALRVTKELRAGITWINCDQPTFNEAPWGGYKKSGIGRELGIHGLEEYQEVKQINQNLNPGVVGWYTHG